MIKHGTCVVNTYQGKVPGVLLFKCYAIGGDTSLDGAGTIINLGKINIITLWTANR